MKGFFSSFFSYSTREKRGLLALLLLLVIVNLVRWVHPYFINRDIGLHVNVVDGDPEFYEQKSVTQTQLHPLFFFDPNIITDSLWLILGLDSRTISIIRNYLDKGGRFREAGDLEKIYTLKSEEFERLAPFIRIENRRIEATPPTAMEETHEAVPGKEEFKVYLNSSDSSDWMQLAGIGPVLSSRIIKFREALGGFYSKEQVAELYGLKPEIFMSISDKIIEDTVELHKFVLSSSLTVQELSNHPYISFKEAKAIKRYMEERGQIESLQDLIETGIFASEKLNRLKVYISFETN